MGCSHPCCCPSFQPPVPVGASAQSCQRIPHPCVIYRKNMQTNILCRDMASKHVSGHVERSSSAGRLGCGCPCNSSGGELAARLHDRKRVDGKTTQSWNSGRFRDQTGCRSTCSIIFWLATGGQVRKRGGDGMLFLPPPAMPPVNRGHWQASERTPAAAREGLHVLILSSTPAQHRSSYQWKGSTDSTGVLPF